MIRKITLAAALLTVSASAAFADTVEWRGAAMLTLVGSSCSASYSVGDAIPVRFRPSGLGTNGTKSVIAFHQTWYAQSFATDGRFSTSLADVRGGHVGAGWGAFDNTARLKLSVSPSTFTASNTNLTMTGSVSNFADITGCTAYFRAAVTQRP